MTTAGQPTFAAARDLARRVLQAALDAVDPGQAVRAVLRRDGSLLLAGDHTYDLDLIDRVFVVGTGKAGEPMAQAVADVLEDRLSAGAVTVKEGTLTPASRSLERVQFTEGGHPIPTRLAMDGANRIVDLAEAADEHDLVICLISGGGSALLPLPVDGVSLTDKQAMSDVLIRSGSTINQINTVRKHVSRAKGGRLAEFAAPAQVLTLVLSDVVGNPLDFIASGPTVPDSTTFADALSVLQQFDSERAVPASVWEHVESGAAGQVHETPKETDAAIFGRTRAILVGSNEIAAEAARAAAQRLGFQTLVWTTYLEGEAREIAKVAGAVAKELVHRNAPLQAPACMIAGGETTVIVRGDGKGGRNQELAVAAADAIRGLPRTLVVAAATDGSDAHPDAAGGMVDGTTVDRGRNRGLYVREALGNNDSYHYLQGVGDLLVTGPTNTNVNDLLFVYSFAS
ncbi:MAG: glycerate kinase [Dehalococcoidia bacterium]|nr:glycerate kinase [Dehalococcoidia bacterium]